MKGVVADYLKYPPRHSPVAAEENSSACPTVHRLVELTIPMRDQVTTKFSCCNCFETKSTSVLQDTKSHTGLHEDSSPFYITMSRFVLTDVSEELAVFVFRV